MKNISPNLQSLSKISLLFVLIFILHACSNDRNKKLYNSEFKEIKDRISGVTIQQLTDYKGHSHHFYPPCA